MMQDSPAVYKNYTLAFYIQKQIATSKLNNYILLASIRLPRVPGTLKIYTGGLS
jgi:hypothetical protein